MIGFGKAAQSMLEALLEVIPAKAITAGVVITTEKPRVRQQHLAVYQGTHPLPSRANLEATRRLMRLKKEYAIDKNDLVLCLVSGGGSSLLCLPEQGVTLRDVKTTTNVLLRSGATIQQINTIRTALSRVKGGKLAQWFFPARVVSCIISDVLGEDLALVASGPTLPGRATRARGTVRRLGIHNRLPASVKTCLRKPYKDKPHRTHAFLLADHATALAGMEHQAKSLGYGVKRLPFTGNPDTRVQAQTLVRRAQQLKPREVLISVGETTLRLPRHPGRGGRNQHFAAQVLQDMVSSSDPFTFASVASDGHDYTTPFAGAIIDHQTRKSVTKKKIPLPAYLDRCDSTTLFKKAGNSLLVTGDTGTNVCDLRIWMR